MDVNGCSQLKSVLSKLCSLLLLRASFLFSEISQSGSIQVQHGSTQKEVPT